MGIKLGRREYNIEELNLLQEIQKINSKGKEKIKENALQQLNILFTLVHMLNF